MLHIDGRGQDRTADDIVIARAVAAGPPRAGEARRPELSLCAGTGGCRTRKREGDGATPIGALEAACRCSTAPTACAVRARPCRSGASAATMAGATRRPTATTTGSCAIPIRPAPSGCGARTHLYDLVVVLGYNDRAARRGRAAAPSSCTSPEPAMRRPRAASRSARAHLLRLHRARWAPRAALQVPWLKKKRPELSLRALRARTGEVACSRSGEAPMERGPRRRRCSVVVGALAVIDEVETFALLVGARTQADDQRSRP